MELSSALSYLPFPGREIPEEKKVIIENAMGCWNKMNDWLKTNPTLGDIEYAINWESYRTASFREEIFERLLVKWGKIKRRRVINALRKKYDTAKEIEMEDRIYAIQQIKKARTERVAD